uniref:SOCS box domain-containing protein n=1 Tax=Biomphalaria glabrata TaxID=6526 RepID=A0A2C9L292_BIOGL
MARSVCPVSKKNVLREAVKHNDLRLITDMLSSLHRLDGSHTPLGVEEEISLDDLLAEAITLKSHHIVSLLLNNGANANSTYKEKSQLFRAVSSGDNDIIKTVLHFGADVRAREPNGKTILHLAATQSSREIISLLMNSGPDIEARDKVQGNTAMHVACTYCNRDAILVLFEHGASVNALNDLCETPLVKILGVVKRKADFHDHSRLTLAKELILLGFVIPSYNLYSPKLRSPNRISQSTHLQAHIKQYKKEISSKHERLQSLYFQLVHSLSKCLTLEGLCRLVILQCLCHKPLHTCVGQLGLPHIMQQYIIRGEKHKH